MNVCCVFTLESCSAFCELPTVLERWLHASWAGFERLRAPRRHKSMLPRPFYYVQIRAPARPPITTSGRKKLTNVSNADCNVTPIHLGLVLLSCHYPIVLLLNPVNDQHSHCGKIGLQVGSYFALSCVHRPQSPANSRRPSNVWICVPKYSYVYTDSYTVHSFLAANLKLPPR